MEETLNEYKKRIASMGGKAVWKDMSEEERSTEMSRRRKKGLKSLKEGENN